MVATRNTHDEDEKYTKQILFKILQNRDHLKEGQEDNINMDFAISAFWN